MLMLHANKCLLQIYFGTSHQNHSDDFVLSNALLYLCYLIVLRRKNWLEHSQPSLETITKPSVTQLQASYYLISTQTINSTLSASKNYRSGNCYQHSHFWYEANNSALCRLDSINTTKWLPSNQINHIFR